MKSRRGACRDVTRSFMEYLPWLRRRLPAHGLRFRLNFHQHLAHPRETALDHRAARALERTHARLRSIIGPPEPSHPRLNTPVYPQAARISTHRRMLSAFTPSPMAQWLTAMPVRSPRADSARLGLTSLMWTWPTRCLNFSRNATGSCPAMYVFPVSMFMPRYGESTKDNISSMNHGLVVK